MVFPKLALFRTSVAALCLLVTAAAAGEMRLVAASPPGSGWDQVARTLQGLAAQIPGAAPIEVVNVPGTTGTVGLQQFVTGADKGRPGLLVTGLSMLDAALVQRSPVTLDRLTPIARLAVEYFAVVVPAAQPIATLDDLKSAMWADPAKVTWAGGPAGGIDHVAAALFSRAIGIDPMRLNYVPFLASGDAATAVADGKVAAAILATGEIQAEVASGRLRVLGITAAPGEEPAGSASLPSLQKAGVPLVLANWRGLVARPGLPAREREELATLVQRITALPGWQELLDRKRWEPAPLGPEAFGAFLRAEAERTRDALKALGLLKRAE